MDYTPEQRAAIDTHDRNVIVIASAGSGKTRVLVDRFVALLVAHPEWPVESLAAITFTEKAALELRDRLRGAIHQRVAQAKTPEARTFWLRRGSGLDGARIGTIHSLCAVIVRANASVLGIDPGFTVLDETDSILAREAALETALNQLATLPAARLFVHYSVEEIRGALDDALKMDLGALDAELAIRRSSELFSEAIAASLASLRSDPEFQAAIEWVPDQAPAPDDKLTPIWETVQTVNADLKSTDNYQLMTALQLCARVIKTNVGTDKNWHGQAKQAKEVLKIIQSWAETLQSQTGLFDQAVESLSAELLPHWYSAANIVKKAYYDHKQILGALDFNDLESYARQMLGQDSVRARYRGIEFQHILVDEFQDTNAAQREIVYALTGLDRPGSLFVVGDPKQAIYGFRGADVAVFEQVQQEIEVTGGEKIMLDTSFRAHSGLINGLNDLFAGLDLGVAYSSLKSVRVMEAHQFPIIEIIGLDQGRAPALKNKKGHVPVDSVRTWQAHLLAERLNALIFSEQLIWDRTQKVYRPVTFADCAVLFPVRKGMPAVEDAFNEANIPFVTVAGIGYYNRPEVQDLLNLLQALSNTADELALATTLRSPLYGVSDEGLYGLRLWHPDRSLWEALTNETSADQPDADAIRHAARSLKRLRGRVGRVTIAELISHGLDATGFLATLMGLSDGARRVGNVEKLHDIARQAGRVSLSDFLTLLRDRADKELREGEAPIDTGDAVQLMTIHASKGLEFPVVALFGADDSLRDRSATLRFDPELGLAFKTPKDTEDDPKDKSRWDKPIIYRQVEQRAAEREQSERIRLLYVALTRAADKLIVLGAYPSEGAKGIASSTAKKHPDWMQILGEKFGMSRDPSEQLSVIEKPWGTIAHYAPRKDFIEEAAGPIALADKRSDVSSLVPVNPSELISAYFPPLLAPIPSVTADPTRTLTAAIIAKLGEAHAVKLPTPPEPPQDRFARFRRQIFHNAPAIIPEIIPSPESGLAAIDDRGHPRRFQRIVGKIVHRALQFGLASSNAQVPELLALYAWQAGLTDPIETVRAAQIALGLLKQSELSEAMQPLGTNPPDRIHRELAFSFQRGERTITGQIDALYLDRAGLWTLLDYKTDDVRPEWISAHSRRYWGQAGIYALAVEAITGQVPRVQLYYVQAAYTVTVRESDWRGALDRFDADLKNALPTGFAD